MSQRVAAHQSPGGPVRVEIDRSWRRSELSGVVPENPLTLINEDFVENDGRFCRAVRTVLDESTATLAGNDLAILVADSAGRIVRRWAGTPAVLSTIDAIGAVVGADFSEERVGTNGLGTPLEVRGELDIHRDDHFVHALHSFSCFGMPVINPMTRRVEGVVDITSTDGSANPLFQPYVSKLVDEIRDELVTQSRVSEQRTFSMFREVTRRATGGVAALCGDLSLTNSRASELLRELDSFVLHEIAAGLGPAERRVLDVDPGSGPAVRIAAQRINGTLDGTLFELDIERRGSGASVTPVGSAGADPPRRVWAELSTTVHIVGEPGSGRTTAALDRAAGQPLVYLECAEAAFGERVWLARCLHLLDDHRGVLVLDDVDLLSEGVAQRLAGRPLTRPELTVVMTSVPELDDAGERLVGLCAEKSALTPLRERSHEFDDVVASMGGGGRRAPLTAAALDRLKAHSWPGNYTELDRVLTVAMSTAVSGLVTVDDLPPELRNPTPPKTEEGRRDEEHRRQITAALLHTAGDKKAAARELGISRTTLYTRMRKLQIH